MGGQLRLHHRQRLASFLCHFSSLKILHRGQCARGHGGQSPLCSGGAFLPAFTNPALAGTTRSGKGTMSRQGLSAEASRCWKKFVPLVLKSSRGASFRPLSHALYLSIII